MLPTYTDIDSLTDELSRADRAPSMPLLGVLSGVPLALALWALIGGLLWVLVN